MEMKVAPPRPVAAEAGRKSATNRLPAGQTLVSQTTGTLIKDGMTTVHETSVIGTTIQGQYAQFLHSRSRVFREPSASILPTAAILGSVQVVTELPSLNALVTQPGTKPAAKASAQPPDARPALPSLESLFVLDSSAPSEPSQQLEEASGRSKGSLDQETESSSQASVQLEPSFGFTPTSLQHQDVSTASASTTSSAPASTTSRVFGKQSASGSASLDRRIGLASSSRTTPRPGRNDDNRWRYNPSPKPKVSILRQDQQRVSSASGGNRFRTTTSATPRDADSGRNSAESDATLTPPAPREESEPEVDPTEVITLRVQTVTPEGYSNWFYEVATIKSPYVMRLGAIKNTDRKSVV